MVEHGSMFGFTINLISINHRYFGQKCSVAKQGTIVGIAAKKVQARFLQGHVRLQELGNKLGNDTKILQMHGSLKVVKR